MRYATDTFSFEIDDRLLPRNPLVLKRGEQEELRIGYAPTGEASLGEILDQESGFQRAFARPGTLATRRGAGRIANWPAEVLESEFRGRDGAGYLGLATAQIWPDRRIEVRYVQQARGDAFDFAGAGLAFQAWMSGIGPLRDTGYAGGWVSIPRRPEWSAQGWLRFESEEGSIAILVSPAGEGPASWNSLFDPQDRVTVKKVTLATQEIGAMRVDQATSHLERIGQEVLAEQDDAVVEVQRDYLGLEATVWNGYAELARVHARAAREKATQLMEMWNRLLASVRAGGPDVERGV